MKHTEKTEQEIRQIKLDFEKASKINAILNRCTGPDGRVNTARAFGMATGMGFTSKEQLETLKLEIAEKNRAADEGRI